MQLSNPTLEMRPRGGYRPGSGRKPSGIERRQVFISFPVDLLAQIDRIAYGAGGSNRSQVVAELCAAALLEKKTTKKKA